jgi:hypothetical protein
MTGRTTRSRPYVPVHPSMAPSQLTPPGADAAHRHRSVHAGAPADDERPPRAPGAVTFELWGQKGWFRQDVAGVSHHLRVIEEVCRAAAPSDSRDPGAVVVTVTLLPEPDNPHDRHAVSIRSGGRVMGYLPREDALRYSPVLLRLADQGLCGEVQARVWSGQHDDYVGETLSGQPRYESVSYASVSLDLDEPHLLVPGNLPPDGAHEVLPIGQSIQVHGEQDHLAALIPFVGPRGEQWVYVSLHELVEQLPRSTRTVLEVRIDGARVGQLSPKLSADLLPAIRFLDERGVLAAARGRTKGNRAAVEVTLHVQRAHQLGDEWFEDVSKRYG